jgi:NADPH:quinone reductase-like Zn-dependent oxidoreductase
MEMATHHAMRTHHRQHYLTTQYLLTGLRRKPQGPAFMSKENSATMYAAVCTAYGPPEVLKLQELPVPTPGPHDVLIRVHASAVNSADWRLRRPDPWGVRLFLGLRKPRIKVLGGVFAGEVVTTGTKVTRFRSGDRLFGSTLMRFGGYGEYVVLPEKATMTTMPHGFSFNEAAALTFGYLTALHYLRKAKVTTGQRVLVVGASGAVGTAAVQLAVHWGARVSGVSSDANLDLVRNLGAERALDYSSDEYAKDKTQYDVVIDTVGRVLWKTHLHRVKPKGKLVLINPGTLRSLYLPLLQPFYKPRIIAGVGAEKREHLELIRDLAEQGKLRPVIDRTYPLAQIAEAHRYVEAGHKKGNVVVMVAKETNEHV